MCGYGRCKAAGECRLKAKGWGFKAARPPPITVRPGTRAEQVIRDNVDVIRSRRRIALAERRKCGRHLGPVILFVS